MTFKTVSSLLSIAAAAGLTIAPVAAAQDQPVVGAQEAEAANALGLPATISVLGKNDPNKRTATAVVNGQVLTGTDIDHRLALLIAANKAGMEGGASFMQSLMFQVNQQKYFASTDGSYIDQDVHRIWAPLNVTAIDKASGKFRIPNRIGIKPRFPQRLQQVEL